MEPKKLDDYLIDVVAAAHRHKVTNWSHEGRSGTFGQIGFIVQTGGPWWRSYSPRSTAKFWFLAANGSISREIGSVDVRFTSPKGRLIARIVELGKAEIAAELEREVNRASAESSGCGCGGSCPCKTPNVLD